LVYKCSTGGDANLNNMCQDPNSITGLEFLVENPPNSELELGVCSPIDDSADCASQSNSTDCISISDGECQGENFNCANANSADNAEEICGNMSSLNCEWISVNECEWEWTFDFDTTGELWIPQNHPGDITPVVKTGNENNAGDSYPGKAWGYLYYSTSTIFDETFLQAQTYGADGETLIIDSRANHDGSSLLLPFTQDGTIGINANPGSGFLGLTPPAAETVDVTVTGSLTDYYQFAVDGGTLAINALGATIINVCDGVDSDGNGITGYCFGDLDGNGTWDNGEDQIFINACSSCQDGGGTWISWDDDVNQTTNGGACDAVGGIWYGNGLGTNGLEPWCGDGIADDDPVFGISNNNGQVVWTIRYFLGINTCDDCDGDNPTCEDFASTISLTLQDPQGGASEGIEVTLIQPVPLDMCP
jgi:hypothetical protein